MLQQKISVGTRMISNAGKQAGMERIIRVGLKFCNSLRYFFLKIYIKNEIEHFINSDDKSIVQYFL